MCCVCCCQLARTGGVSRFFGYLMCVGVCVGTELLVGEQVLWLN